MLERKIQQLESDLQELVKTQTTFNKAVAESMTATTEQIGAIKEAIKELKEKN